MEKIFDKQSVNQEPVKVRCPQCFKLYKVDFSSIALERPKFQCNQCQEKFSIQVQDCQGLDEIIGFAESWEEKKNNEDVSASSIVQRNDEVCVQEKSATEPVDEKKATDLQKEKKTEEAACPKCKSLNPIDALECKQCHVVIKKFVEIKKDPAGVNVPQKLKEIWQMVLNHYEDIDLHQEFIRQCRKAGHLEFAASRYKRILDAQPKEEIALKFRKELVVLATIVSESADTPTKIKNSDRPKIRVPFTSIAMLLSSILMFVGYMTPEFRNLMGIGAAFLFITTAIRLIFK